MVDEGLCVVFAFVVRQVNDVGANGAYVGVFVLEVLRLNAAHGTDLLVVVEDVEVAR